MGERTDAELVKLARAGDQIAFGRLIERYQGMAKRIALGMVADEDTSRELVQEAMLQAYLSLRHLQDDERFSSWLYGIVLNVCRGHLRAQKIDYFSWEGMAGGLRFEAIPFSGVDPDPQEVVEAREMHRLVLEAVNALSPKNRAAVLLFYYDQLSQREIAALLDISVAAVKGRLHKARGQLKAKLWPVYSEMRQIVSADERRKTMVKVSIADVVVLKREDENQQEAEKRWREHYVVVLLDEAGKRALPIWVGPVEGAAIAMGLRQSPFPRPMTHDFVASLLEATKVDLKEIRIEALKEDTFYAVVKLRNGDSVQEVDARPSDALALAVRVGCPVYAAEAVLDAAGMDVSSEMAQRPPLGQGLDDIVRKIEEEQKQHHAYCQSRPLQSDEEREAEKEANQQKLKGLVFSSENSA